MQASLRFLVIFTLLVGQGAYAESCEPQLKRFAKIRQLGNNFAQFWNEDFSPNVRSTYGRRVILREQKPNEPRGAECFYEPMRPRAELGPVRGFFRDCNAVNMMYWLLNDHERTHVLQPIRGSIRYALREPIAKITDHWLGRRETLTAPFYWPTFLLLTALPWIGAYSELDAITDHASQNLIQEEVQANRPQYLHELKSNYEFHEIRRQLESGEIDEQQAATSVRALLEYLNHYYTFKRDLLIVEHPTDAQIAELLQLPMFAPLKGIATKGLQQDPSLEIPKERLGIVPREAIYMMIRITDMLYFKYQIIRDFVNQSEDYKGIVNSHSVFAETAKSLEQDPFTVQLLEMEKANQITLDQVQYALGEAAYWESRLKYYEILGAKFKIPGGGYAELEDFKDSILDRFKKDLKPQ